MREDEGQSEAELELDGWEQWERAKRRRSRKAAHHRNRRQERAGNLERKTWRSAPATPTQLRELRRIASATGNTFCTNVTQGEAWRRIRQATALVTDSARLGCAPAWYRPRKARKSRISALRCQARPGHRRTQTRVAPRRALV